MSKNRIPVLPLRDIVVFPHMVAPLFVGRKLSVNALNHVMTNDKLILLITQKSSEIDNPSAKDLYKFGSVHNIPSYVQKDKCIFQLRSRCEELIDEIRSGKGPRFIEVYTNRWLEHVGPNEDWHLGYRSEQEKSRWLKEDQVRILGEMLKTSERKDIEKQVKEELKKAILFAEKSPFPGKEDLYENVYR